MRGVAAGLIDLRPRALERDATPAGAERDCAAAFLRIELRAALAIVEAREFDRRPLVATGEFQIAIDGALDGASQGVVA